MKKYLYVVIFLSFGISAYGSPVDHLLTRYIPDCRNIALNAVSLIPRYMKQGSLDSVHMVLDGWKELCDETQPDDNIILLLAIMEGNYTDTLLSNDFMKYARQYDNRFRRFEYTRNYPDKSPSDRIYTGYYTYITGLADSLLNCQKRGTSEFLLCLLFSGKTDAFYRELASNSDYHDSRLRKLFFTQVETERNKLQTTMGIFAGVWSPQEKAKRLGAHPNIGLAAGLKVAAFTLGINMAFKFQEAAEPYQVAQAGSVYTVTHFFGGNMGVEANLEVFRQGRHVLEAACGFGFEGFDALEKMVSAEEQSISINTWCLYPGFDYRYYYSRSGTYYFGVRFRCYLTDYNSNEELVTDLSGHALTLELVWGGTKEYQPRYRW